MEENCDQFLRTTTTSATAEYLFKRSGQLEIYCVARPHLLLLKQTTAPPNSYGQAMLQPITQENAKRLETFFPSTIYIQYSKFQCV